MCLQSFASSPLFGRCTLKPPAHSGWRSRCRRSYSKKRSLSNGRADVVEVGAEHDQYGEEGETEAEGSHAAVQREAEPVDQPVAEKHKE